MDRLSQLIINEAEGLKNFFRDEVYNVATEKNIISFRFRVNANQAEYSMDQVNVFAIAQYNINTESIKVTTENSQGSRKYNRHVKHTVNSLVKHFVDTAKQRHNAELREEKSKFYYECEEELRGLVNNEKDKLNRCYFHFNNMLELRSDAYTIDQMKEAYETIKVEFLSDETLFPVNEEEEENNVIEGGSVPPSTHNTTPIDLQFFSALPNPITEGVYTVNEYGEKVYFFNPNKKIDVNHIKSLFDSLSYTGTRYNNKPDSYSTHDTLTHVLTYNGSDGEVMEIGFSSGLILSAKCFSDFDNMVTTILSYINGNTVTMTINETVYTPRQLNKKGHTEVRKPNLNIVYTIEYTDKDEEININYSNLKKFEVNNLNSLVMDVATLRKDNKYNISAYMEIYEGEKLIASDMVTTDIEFVPSATEREHMKQLRLENEQIKRDMEHVNAYNAFLKKYKAEKLFEKFLEEEWYKKK